MMLNCDRRYRFVDQYLTLMIGYFSCTPMCIELVHIHVSQFDSDILITSAKSITTNVYKNMLVMFLFFLGIFIFYLIQVNKKSFVKTGKNAEFSI